MNPFFAQHLLEFAPDAFLLIDTEGRIHYANRAVEEIFGYRPEDLTGLRIEHLVPQRCRGSQCGFPLAYTSPLKTRDLSPQGAPLMALRRDGSEIGVEISLTSVNLDGELHIFAVIRAALQNQQSAEFARAAPPSLECTHAAPASLGEGLQVLQATCTRASHD